MYAQHELTTPPDSSPAAEIQSLLYSKFHSIDVFVRQHAFDVPTKNVKRRKPGDISSSSAPACNPQAVRVHHRLHEQLILSHRRDGYQEQEMEGVGEYQ